MIAVEHQNVHKVLLSTNDFEIKPKKYVSHSVFDRVDMHSYVDVNSALKSIRKYHGDDTDLAGDNSSYFEFSLMVCSSSNENKRNEKFWLDFTPLHYGGWRYWLKCLECRHRKTKLYVTRNRVACMDCLGLIYTSRTGSRDSPSIRILKHIKAMNMLREKRRMIYAGKTTRYGRRFQRYYQDLNDLTDVFV